VPWDVDLVSLPRLPEEDERGDDGTQGEKYGFRNSEIEIAARDEKDRQEEDDSDEDPESFGICFGHVIGLIGLISLIKGPFILTQKRLSKGAFVGIYKPNSVCESYELHRMIRIFVAFDHIRGNSR